MLIDAHQHVWNLDKSSYEWLDDSLMSIRRSIGFDEAREQLQLSGVTATVLVQSDDSDSDTDHLFDVQSENNEVVGVVGYVPLGDPERTDLRLRELRERQAFVGIRNLIHDLPDPDWLLRPNVSEGLSILEAAEVPFDMVAVLPRHLEVLLEVSERHPDLRVVIDHLAKPPVGVGDCEPWWSLIAEVAKNPNVYGKLSGLYAAGPHPEAWTADTVAPFVDRAISVFGIDRLMYGGDWPMSVLAGGYGRVFRGVLAVTAGMTEAERKRLFCGTVSDFYRLDEALLERAKGEQ